MLLFLIFWMVQPVKEQRKLIKSQGQDIHASTNRSEKEHAFVGNNVKTWSINRQLIQMKERKTPK